ncbi:SDR family oxidoreductase [Roseivirga misakiensis]|uniref:NAD-dependent dehydratase n=1 Tax=Roseivirga misakiensis TaxID=1563681 RepID=A0A1E5SY42_9BACT|nr:SDR family oxidoreductase [Roseivirga misakiensis]OEK04036.1 NAD-dependent dehydratase [Roseivirga misakiensis]
MKKEKILVAGATGYLGRHIVKELQFKGINFQVIARTSNKLKDLGLKKGQIIEAEVTKPNTLNGVMDQIDVVISTVGITRQKDGLTYMDVDYQANMNLLHEAKAAGVAKFIYVSVIGGDQMRHLKIMEAKEKFVDALTLSGLDYTIIRPNGFYSDMKDFLEMAKKGRVYLFGDGEFKLNPIHGADLAQAVADSIESDQKEIEIGGPDILTQNEIAALALRAWKRPLKISHIPNWVKRIFLSGLKIFTSSKTYGPFEFFLAMMARNNIAPRHGIHRLESFFMQEVDKLN